jgi:hypothetical protein
MLDAVGGFLPKSVIPLAGTNRPCATQDELT